MYGGNEIHCNLEKGEIETKIHDVHVVWFLVLILFNENELGQRDWNAMMKISSSRLSVSLLLANNHRRTTSNLTHIFYITPFKSHSKKI